MKLTKVDSMCSRTGRDLQRYNVQGCRQVVGCIPYRYREGKQSAGSIIHGAPLVDDLEFLLVSSQKSPRMMFPKGGWEQDESLEEAALRETFEEAGVYGEVGSCLGKWFFKSKSLGVLHEGFMLPLIVLEELDDWPEKDVRQRSWVSYREAMEVCFHPWMKEALDVLVSQLTLQQEEDENEARNGMMRNIELEPSIEILAQGNRKEETRMSSGVGESVKRKVEERHHHQLLIEILVSDEPLSIVAQSLHQRNEDPRTSCCSFEFLRTEEPRMGISLHRNEEPRTSCSMEFLRKLS
ncbi:PREDICTED: nudix hydrolase 18, mitochondrial-like [Ipomoea nil]|uniref:nudix hydrolase 18, mitochondrial-like n=1 Tax=Ipomoea nil TaxID=35883 RepID=UPI000901CB41|nr:PREDICTED: nudix hydrolase 18, mitochondrial-like [Ipomoea nil]